MASFSIHSCSIRLPSFREPFFWPIVHTAGAEDKHWIVCTFSLGEKAMTATPTRTRPILRRSLAPAVAAMWAILLLKGASPVWAAPPSPAGSVRFLEQATFGPAPDLIAHVQQIGFAALLKEQFNLPLPIYPNLGLWPPKPPDNCKADCKLNNYTMYSLQVRFFRNV